jgi:branched-chain amino acid transport system substrate-binding protein
VRKSSYLPTIALSVIAAAIAGWVLLRPCANNQVKSGLICTGESSGTKPGKTAVNPPRPVKNVTPSSPSLPSQPATPPGASSAVLPSSLEQRFSRGDRTLFRGEGNPDRDNGVLAFSKKDYSGAIDAFTRSVASGRNDPEPQVYLNNARAYEKGNPYTFAVVVPIDNRVDVAKEILRGAADAQEQFNQAGGKEGRLLELLIVNDGNNPEIAKQTAVELAKMPGVLGVIGHNASEASLKALPEYEKSKLAMISPTSTSIELKGSTFFRTVPSDQAAGERLANYVVNSLSIKKVIIFYDETDTYSKSLKQTFAENFKSLGGTEPPLVDLASSDLDAAAAVQKYVGDVRVAMLFPSAQTVPRAISVARANEKLAPAQQLRLLGGDALYDNRTLINGGQAIEGLTLAVPWFGNSAYAERANERWGGRINWRTASSYDAVQALVKTLTGSVSREQVVQSLKSLQLSPSETSGNALEFDASGNREEEPLLVQTSRGVNRPRGSDFGFELAP